MFTNIRFMFASFQNLNELLSLHKRSVFTELQCDYVYREKGIEGAHSTALLTHATSFSLKSSSPSVASGSPSEPVAARATMSNQCFSFSLV